MSVSMRVERSYACMLRTIVKAAILSMLVASPIAALTTSLARPVRINFAHGALSSQVRGQLTKNKSLDALYVVKAKAGDHMIVNVIPLTEGLMTGGDVTSPSGAQDGQHGGIIFNADLTESGDFTIRVSRNLMGTQRPDGAFILEVVITPASLKR